MMNTILLRQSFSTTPLFKQIFSRMLMERNGTFKDKNSVVHARPDFDEAYLLNVSKTINDLLRFIALVQYGTYFADKSNVAYINEDGGVSAEYGTLIDPQNLDNIFNRVTRLQEDILSGKYGDRLVSDDGQILNSFIKSLIVTNRDGVKRVVLAQSPMDMSIAKKNQIIADYYNAMIDESSEVRQLAEDLALYFYFNRYDTASRSNMFSIVPIDARSQYDKAISFALNGDFLTIYSAEQVTDVLFRNYWRDDSIVPELNLTYASSGTLKSIDDMKGVHTLYSVQVGNKKIPGVIISSYETSMYVKVHRGGSDYYLYKKVGDITVHGEKDKVYNKSVYRIYPKAGTIIENENIYEYDIIQHLSSAYPENDLPSQFAPGIFDPEQIITDFISTSKEPQKYALDIRYKDEAQLFNYSSPEQYNKDKDKIAGDGNVAVVIKSTIDRDSLGKYLQNVRRVEFGAQSDDATWSGRARDVKVGKKTDIKSVVDAMTLKSGSRITVYLYGSIPTTKNTKSEINQYIKEQTARLSDLNLSEEELNSHKEYVKEVADEMVTNRKKQEYIHDLLYEIQNRDIEISAVVTLLGEDCAGQVMRAVMDITRDDPGFFSENTIPGWIYVSKEFYNKGKNQDYFDYFKTEASYDYYDVPTDGEEAVADIMTKQSNVADVVTSTTDDIFNILKAGDLASMDVANTIEPLHDDQAAESC